MFKEFASKHSRDGDLQKATVRSGDLLPFCFGQVNGQDGHLPSEISGKLQDVSKLS